MSALANHHVDTLETYSCRRLSSCTNAMSVHSEADGHPFISAHVVVVVVGLVVVLCARSTYDSRERGPVEGSRSGSLCSGSGAARAL